MGVMLIPVAETDENNFAYKSDGRTIIYFFHELDKISSEKSKKTFKDFFVDEEKLNLSAEIYHSAQEGLEIIEILENELLQIQKQDSILFININNISEILNELSLLKDWLLSLGDNNRFYLVIA